MNPRRRQPRNRPGVKPFPQSIALGQWTQSYGYDGARRLTGVTSPAGSFGYTYDAVRKSQVALLTLPGGAYITNTFDSVARLTGTYLKGGGDTNIDFNTYAYNYAGQRTQTVWTAGNYVDYTYDNGGELKLAKGKEAGGVTNRLQEQFGYRYDGGGNLTGRTNNARVLTFGVNTLNELTGVTRSGTLTVAGSTTMVATNVTVNGSNAVRYADMTYAASNITLMVGLNTFTAIAKDSLGDKDTNVASVNLPSSNYYAYDLNGNLRTNDSLVLDYDDENQLIRVTVTNGWKNEYVYDGKFRRRIEKDYTWSGSWIQTNEIHFIYDGNNVIQERDTNNVPLVTYTRTGNTLLARTDNDLLNRGSLYAHAYYHRDGNGNVTYLLFANQTLAAKYAYDPFGNVLALSGVLANANVYRFASKEWDERTGFYYFGRRYYDPNLQRFVNRDPLAERGGLNLYAYCRNNPVSLIDLLGLCPPESDVPWWMQRIDQPQNDTAWDEFLTSLGMDADLFGYSLFEMPYNWSANVANGYSDAFHNFGSGTADAYYNGQSGWDWAIGVSQDVARGSLIASLFAPASGLTEGGATATTDTIAFNITHSEDGTILITHPENANTYIRGQVSNGNLDVTMVYVQPTMWQQGISKQLYQTLVNEAGSVQSITGTMAFQNQLVIQELMDEGYSAQAAAAMTPAASARAATGFTLHSYDPVTEVLTSTKP